MGDPDPDKNPDYIGGKRGKTNSVPKDVIDRAIKKSQSLILKIWTKFVMRGMPPALP